MDNITIQWWFLFVAGTILQRKWKSLRASYTRELLRQKTEKSGSAATGRKKYIYFDQLRFLTTDCKSTTSSIDNDDDEDTNEFDEGENVDQKAREKTAVRPQKRQREKKSIEEEEDIIYNILKEKLARTKDNSSQPADEDILFMQSLVPELKKLPHHARLKVKSDLMNVILNAQQYYCTSASSSSQIGFVPNYATGGPYHDRPHRGTIQGYTGGQSRLPDQLPAVCSPTVSEYSDESLIYFSTAQAEQQ